MPLYKLLSILLEYPTKTLTEHWSEIEQMIAILHEHIDRVELNRFIDWARQLPLTQLQANYVKTFDFAPDNALYLTHHLFDEQDSQRGPALIALTEYYESEGFEITDGELPDYLPLVLEYVSTLDDETSARLFLHQSVHASEIVADNLEKIASPYAPLLRIIERHGHLAELAA
jgi:nitrate reductase delta subunit